MATLTKFYKLNQLPDTYEPNDVYFIPDPTDPTKFIQYQTTSDGSTVLENGTGGGVSAPVKTFLITDATLAGINQDVLVNSSFGSLDIELPLVSTEVEIRFFMRAGNNRVRINENSNDPNNIIIGRNRITMSRLFDTVTLKAIDGIWFIVS